uniref:Peptidase S1 domain-containing protein n=1 Tax=Neogobius melanostomus TaxID=47308 RepID=A0A8C6UNI5_9GOBI
CFLVILQYGSTDGVGVPHIPHTARIVGGKNATAGSWPWQVSMHHDDAHLCGGTVINTEWVLTAAHCIITGSNPNEVNRTVSQIIVHPDYNKGTRFNNDIALMKLSSPITYSTYIRPVCLAANGSLFYNGTRVWATGWGQPLVAHDVLQEVQIPVIGHNECGCYYTTYNLANVTSAMICAGELGKGICQGDSGGPIQYRQGAQWIQAGIASFGVPCAIGFPEVFARVSYFQLWIMNQTGGTNVSFVESTSSGTDPDSSFVCSVVTPTNTTTAPNTTASSPGSRTVSSELAFVGTVAMILLMPLLA